METKHKSTSRSLLVKRIIEAPRNIVWEAWTDQDLVQQWWGPNGFSAPLCEWEARPGNKILVHMQAPDGMIYTMAGEFRETDKPGKLVFKSEALDNDGNPVLEAINTITLAEKRHSTVMTLYIDVTKVQPEAEVYLKGMDEGWRQSLNKLEEFISKHVHAELEA